MIPIYASYILLASLFLTIRAVLLRLHAVAAESRHQQAVTAIAVAEARSRSRFVRLVHDEVLASLTAAIHVVGRPSPAVRNQVAEALTILEHGGAQQPAMRVSCDQVRLRLLQIAEEMELKFEVTLDTQPGQVRAGVADTLLSATREAMRNSVRHAGRQAAREVHARISATEIHIEVCDDGPGFDPSSVGFDRLGVRQSIVAAVEKLDGGSARIDTSRGTQVVLQWKP